MRDHGGNLDAAIARFGAGEWLDLSTGINPLAYPVPALSNAAWASLPTMASMAGLEATAARAYATQGAVAPLTGAQQGIQLLPLTRPPGLMRVLSPTYNEHAASFERAGWRVEGVSTLSALRGADIGVVVNPNNPDGQRFAPEDLRALHGDLGLLVVDESFADPEPALSLAPEAGTAGLLVLRSFGKFYGLAGLRLGFALGDAALVAQLRALAGPWPICGAAIEIGRAALADEAWRAQTTARLAQDAAKLDALMPLPVVGGTTLFRLYAATDAAAAQEALARHHVWSRIFPYSSHWLRLGLPGTPGQWAQMQNAVRALA